MPELSFSEIKLMQQIIAVCSKRGAILPEEFGVVGVLNDRLNEIIDEDETPKIEEK